MITGAGEVSLKKIIIIEEERQTFFLIIFFFQCPQQQASKQKNKLRTTLIFLLKYQVISYYTNVCGSAAPNINTYMYTYTNIYSSSTLYKTTLISSRFFFFLFGTFRGNKDKKLN